MIKVHGLRSLFFRGKKSRFVLDGVGMEREIWRRFTISQSSDVYEQNFAYTVKYDEALDEAHLCVDVYDYRAGYPVEKRARLKRDTLNALFCLNMMSFPDEIPFESKEKILDGTFLTFFVIDQNGNVLKKRLSYENEQKILGLILPYVKKLKGKSI
jgi:hypothetical protein